MVDNNEVKNANSFKSPIDKIPTVGATWTVDFTRATTDKTIGQRPSGVNRKELSIRKDRWGTISSAEMLFGSASCAARFVRTAASRLA